MSAMNLPESARSLWWFAPPLALIAFAGCDASQPVDPLESRSSLAVGAPVLPPHETTVFRGYARPWAEEGAGPEVEIDALRVEIIEAAVGRRADVFRGDSFDGTVDVDANGRIADTSPEVAAARDVLDLLPPPSTSIEVGRSYANAPASLATVLANHALGRVTLTQRLEITPRSIRRWAFGTMVRVDFQSFNRIYTILGEDRADQTPVVHHFDAGFSNAGIADLLYVPNSGWRLLRLARLSPIEAEGAPTTLEGLRDVPHHRFTACVAESSIVPNSIVSMALATSRDVPELSACR